MSSLRHLLAPVLLAAHRWRGGARSAADGAFRILLLHDIPRDHEAALDRLLADAGRTGGFVSPEDVGTPIRRAGGGVPILVTFDDGFRSNLGVAERILARHGVEAVFFVCPGLIDLNPADQAAAVARQVFRGAVSVPPPLMSWDEIGSLAAMGHTIAAHTLTHRSLVALSGADLSAEVVESGDRIEQRLGRPVDWFAFPFGDIASIGAEAMAVIAGRYRICRSGVRGLNHVATDPLALLAEHVDLGAPDAYQRLALEGGLDPRHATARATLTALAAGVRRGCAQ